MPMRDRTLAFAFFAAAILFSMVREWGAPSTCPRIVVDRTPPLQTRPMSGVENRRSGYSLPVACVRLLSQGAPQSGLAWLCFLFPLIEPDRRVSRIRLSEKVSRFRPRKAACPSGKFDKAQHLMQGSNWKLLGCLPTQLVLSAQPLA